RARRRRRARRLGDSNLSSGHVLRRTRGRALISGARRPARGRGRVDRGGSARGRAGPAVIAVAPLEFTCTRAASQMLTTVCHRDGLQAIILAWPAGATYLP